MSTELFTESLFSRVLLQPAHNSTNALYIVSGYASSAMAFHHAENLKQQGSKIKIHLIIGMTAKDGLSKTNHLGFKSLMESELAGKFECSYLIDRAPVHSKVYSWLSHNKPVKGFTGSVNYSQQAFIGKHQGEVATECNPVQAYDYYQSLVDDSIFCTHQDAEEIIALYSYNQTVQSSQEIINEDGSEYDSTLGLEKITVSLISKQLKDVGPSSGLNWGHRKKNKDKYNRNLNEAYIQLPSDVYKSDFFPVRATHFTISTDDGKTLICTRAQKDAQGHAIETPHNNSLLGEYFRHRLGVANSKIVTLDHLHNYGRTDIDFYKIDEENYFMDFSLTRKINL
jgi:hypothetical protein